MREIIIICILGETERAQGPPADPSGHFFPGGWSWHKRLFTMTFLKLSRRWVKRTVGISICRSSFDSQFSRSRPRGYCHCCTSHRSKHGIARLHHKAYVLQRIGQTHTQFFLLHGPALSWLLQSCEPLTDSRRHIFCDYPHEFSFSFVDSFNTDACTLCM